MSPAVTLRFEDLVIGHGNHAVAGPLGGLWESGRLWVLSGANGCGKTTLLRTLLGLQPALSGRVTGLGAHRVSYVPQRRDFDPAFPVTAAEVVSTGLRRSGIRRARKARIRDALEAVDLADMGPQPFFRLSGGQAERVLIARALVAEARVIALDEPTAGIDPAMATRVWELLATLASEDRLVIVVTHDLARADRYANDRLVLSDGLLAPTP